MRACFLSDLHAHTWKQYARMGKDGLNTRLADLEVVLSEVWCEAVRRKALDVYVGGDLFHVKRHVPVQAETVLYDSFEDARKMGLRLHIISGNHDQVEDDAMANTPRIFRDVAEVHATPAVIKEQRVVYVPWQFDQERVRKLLKDLKGEWQLLLYHGEVAGAFVGPTDYQLKSKMKPKDLMAEKFEWVMMGHLHRRQQVGERMYYIGNPLPKDRGEPEQNKGAVFIIDDEVHVFVTNHPRFVSLDVTKGWDRTPSEWIKQCKGNFVHLTVPAKISAKDLDELLSALQPREWEIHRAPVSKEKEKVTNVRLGQTLEEMFDAYVDEEGGGDTLKKEFGRALLQESAVEGESH
jgi:DNA repair exonuclease SbcCD nuclease subunit